MTEFERYIAQRYPTFATAAEYEAAYPEDCEMERDAWNAALEAAADEVSSWEIDTGVGPSFIRALKEE